MAAAAVFDAALQSGSLSDALAGRKKLREAGGQVNEQQAAQLAALRRRTEVACRCRCWRVISVVAVTVGGGEGGGGGSR